MNRQLHFCLMCLKSLFFNPFLFANPMMSFAHVYALVQKVKACAHLFKQHCKKPRNLTASLLFLLILPFKQHATVRENTLRIHDQQVRFKCIRLQREASRPSTELSGEGVPAQTHLCTGRLGFVNGTGLLEKWHPGQAKGKHRTVKVIFSNLYEIIWFFFYSPDWLRNQFICIQHAWADQPPILAQLLLGWGFYTFCEFFTCLGNDR